MEKRMIDRFYCLYTLFTMYYFIIVLFVSFIWRWRNKELCMRWGQKPKYRIELIWSHLLLQLKLLLLELNFQELRGRMLLRKHFLLILSCEFSIFGIIWLQQLNNTIITYYHLEYNKIFEDIWREKVKLRIISRDKETDNKREGEYSHDSGLFVEKNEEKMNSNHLIGDEKSLSINTERISPEDIVCNSWYLSYLLEYNTFKRYSIGTHIF